MADDTTLTGSFSDPASGTQLGNCTPSDVNTTVTCLHIPDIVVSQCLRVDSQLPTALDLACYMSECKLHTSIDTAVLKDEQNSLS